MTDATTMLLMLHDTPLRALHERFVREMAELTRPAAGADRPGAAVGRRLVAPLAYLPYGVTEQVAEPLCDVLASFGDVEPEYAAIRRGAAVFDSPHRGTLLVTGNDRREFLNRMLTQELKDLSPGSGPGAGAGVARESFWLNRKGRIEADLMVIELGGRMLVDVDLCQAASAAKTLGEFVFSEDVAIADVSAQFHHLAVHGPLALRAIAVASGQAADGGLAPGEAMNLAFDGVPATIVRRDQTGEPGLELIIPRDRAGLVWNALLTTDQSNSDGRRRIRPIGWHAYNIARIEAGTPLMNIDFGTTNLPHETGVLRQRVSFTKGCYLGQEIVARMESLGRPKQELVGLRLEEDLLPVVGAQVFAMGAQGEMGEQIGTVTSSTLSPMLGAQPIAFAMIRTAHAAMGAAVLVNAEGAQAKAVIHTLRFHPEATAAGPAV
jgi:folate-binding protein YgfZ